MYSIEFSRIICCVKLSLYGGSQVNNFVFSGVLPLKHFMSSFIYVNFFTTIQIANILFKSLINSSLTPLESPKLANVV